MIKSLANYLIHESATIKDAMLCINRNTYGIALLVTDDNRLLSTITDADIRSAVLTNIDTNQSVLLLVKNQESLPFKSPMTATEEASNDEILAIMKRYGIRHVPIVDENFRPVGLVILDDLIEKEIEEVQVLLMAGGLGSRLKPLTDNIPKPMLKIDDKPMLEILIDLLKKHNFVNFNISVRYLKEQIINYFGDGKNFGINISYIEENEPLGTGGSLKKIEKKDVTTLVMNADILTDLNINLFQSFHAKNNADLTLGIKQHEVQIPFGVVDVHGISINSLQEKPKLYYFINTGIYMISPNVLQNLPVADKFDMTNLVDYCLEHKHSVVNFPVYAYWNDIGTLDSYQRAVSDYVHLKSNIV